MKFVIPQNYNFKNKFLGIIDYSTLIINVIFYLLNCCSYNSVKRDFKMLVMDL